MKVLGLNGYTDRGHDGGASLIIDGKLISAVEEEKFTGLRHAYDTMPLKSIEYCLKEANLTIDDIDCINFGWDFPYIYSFTGQTLTKEKICELLFNRKDLANKFNFVNHHLCHAYSTFYPSNFDEALVLIIDGQGEIMGTSIYLADRKNKKMKLLMETPISLGYFYTAITKQIGFRGGEEGKTMGLASYGKPVYAQELLKHINLDKNGNMFCTFKVDKDSKDEEEKTISLWRGILDQIIPKRKGKIIDVDDSIIPYANLASSAQAVLEKIVTGLIKKYYDITKVNKVAIAGGVGLNCPTSSSIENLDFIEDVFIQPAANDGGISLGACIKGALDMGDDVNFEMIPYTGPEYTDEQILETIKQYSYSYAKCDNIENEIAKLIYNNKIVANFQGRLEFGPRALGNRSLLASPEKYEMLVKMNTLKGREVWRPLAPAVMFDKQDTCFDYKKFSPYMTKNCKVLKTMQHKLQAITHVDETARIQSVDKIYNERFYNIINEFYKLSGIPVVINTSFNIKGMPIVCTPKEAVESAVGMNLDYLAIGNYLVNLKKYREEL